MQSFKDSVTLITGASAGIGAALAREMAKQGATLVLIARRKDRLTALKDELTRTHFQLTSTFYSVDITKADQVDQMIDDIIRRFYRIDVLINNAAFGIDSLFGDTPMQAERDIFETNVFSALHLMKRVLPVMEKQGAGKIMNIGSVVGHRAMPVMSSYCATKAALRSYTEAIRVEYAKKGVQIMYASPGHTRTEFLQNQKRFGAAHRKGVGVSPMPAEICAKRLVCSLRKNKRDTVLTSIGKLGLLLNRFAPSLLDRILLSRV